MEFLPSSQMKGLGRKMLRKEMGYCFDVAHPLMSR